MRILLLSFVFAFSGCASLTDFLQQDSTKAALRVAAVGALNIGLSALSQYANGGGNVNWGAAALFAAPIALRTLESTPAAANEAEISAAVAASIADWRLKRKVSVETAAVISKAIEAGVPPDHAVETVASSLDVAVASFSVNNGLDK